MARYLRGVGIETITSLSAAVGLTVPNEANYVLIDIEDQDVRYRADGSDPTASVGGLLKVGAQYEYVGNLGMLKFIETTPSAKINVSYFKRTEV